ncbi:MAG: hypothetical protein HS113_29960 [Verrucomicrobiales bacterium]|nr:hypothetical protein [Verrucomicrobiales bacterium]
MEQSIANPSWRPTFRVPAALSLGGFALCVLVMMMVSPGATILATLVSVTLYSLMKRRSLRARWGDMRLGILMFGARQILYRMAGRKFDERTWCPNLLVFSGAPTARWYLIELAQALSRDRSFVTVATIIPEAHWSLERAESLRASVRQYLGERDVQAFIRVLPGDDPLRSAQDLIRAYGFGPLVPNTVLLGETEQEGNIPAFAQLVLSVAQSRRNLVIVREAAPSGDTLSVTNGPAETSGAPRPTPRRIDVWSRGRSQNAGFMLALGFLLQQSDRWRGTELVLKRVVGSPEEEAGATKELASLVESARLRLRTEVLVLEAAGAFEVIRRSSADADLVVLGLRPPDPAETVAGYGNYYRWLLRETDPLPATVLAMATEDLDFGRIFANHPP